MSMWTHITACLSVDTGLTKKRGELKRIIQKELKEAPKITGSEGNADIFVNVQSDYNFVTNADCSGCGYMEIDTGACCAPEKYTCKKGRYQTCVTISVQGDLRDRLKERTASEFGEFLEYLRKRYYVRDYSVNIQGD